MRALASAEDQQGWRMIGDRRDSEELGPDGYADYTGIAEELPGVIEVDCGRGDALADNLVGEAGNIVRLECECGNSAENGGGHGGTGSVSADADDDIRTKPADESA